jgi:diguanylate cyclase (GGDEF)-like protein/PAS domain S-box-containing protein
VRSILRWILISAIGFGVPIAGTLTVRPGLPGLPAGLWTVALVPVIWAAISRGFLRSALVAVLGAALLAGTYVTGLRYGLTVAPAPPWPLQLSAWAAAALLCVAAGGAFGSSRRRAGRLLSLTDPVTGLPNRRHAELFLQHEFAVAELGRPMAMLLLDVDRFRSYVASSGEAAGQALLRAVGGILRQNTRNANLSAHWADDRFACLLVGANPEGALMYARRLQDHLRASAGVATIPSVSIGAACYDPEMRSTSDLVGAAESALVQAKRDGGDRIRIHGRNAEESEAAETSGSAREALMSGRTEESEAPRPTSSGVPRTGFVFASDPAVRRRATEQLERRGVRVTEVSRPVEGMRALAAEFDLVVVDLAQEDPGVADLVREVRRRYPAARILGIPGYEGNAINPAVLKVRVDGHLLRTNGSWTFQPPLEDLLRERDRMRETALRALQLSDEVRVKEREAQRARVENEARMRSLVQSIREVIFRTDRSGAWISLSPAWSTLTGQAVEQSLGRPWLEFFHEDDRDALAREFDALTSVEKPYLRREARIKTRSGGTRWVEVRAQLAHDRFGNVLSASGTLADITDRRRVEEALHRSEEYFRALIENAADLIAVIDADGRIRYVSPAAERMLGHAADDGVLLTALEELIHEEDVPALQAALRAAETPGATAAFEARFRHADGSWRHLAASIRNLTHIAAVRGWVVNAHDVTAHHEAERALRESEEALYRARKMDAIGMLAGGIAHDFNNLLTSIQGHADIAIGALATDHPIRSDLVRIQEAAVRAGSLTRQLLAFGRRQVLRPRIIDLNVFLSDMHKMMVRMVGEQIQLRTELGASPARVKADPMQIERAILNLAMNAREAMPHGGSLTLRTQNTFVGSEDAKRLDAASGAYVVITVADTGHGIPQEFLAHVFDPFFTTKPQAVGVGLGLSTVYGIIRQSGGYIRVDSREQDTPGEPSGTTFSIYLPATREAAASVAPAPRPQPDPGETIALVEDEPAVRDLATRVLRGRGYNVIPAENGRQALDVLGRYPNRVDMLVTDVVMPEMGGRDLADRVGMMRPGVKILFMSGYSTDAVEQQGVLAHGSAFLEKPFSPDSLLRKVRDMLDVMEPGEREHLA